MTANVSKTNDAESYYYSGQGVVLLGILDAVTKRAKYYEPVGNCKELKVTINTTVVDHKGAQDGQRAIDKRIQTETKAQASMTVDSWKATVLAKALRGNTTAIAATTGATETLVTYLGKVQALARIGLTLSTFAVSQGATALDAFVDEATPYDYTVNAAAGSLTFNDGSKIPTSKMGAVPTAIAVGATTDLTVVSTAAVGEQVYLTGFTGADGAFLNNKSFTVVSNNGTHVVISAVTTGKIITVTGTTKVVSNGMSMTVTYDYGAQNQIDALTQPLTEIPVRFEGLNTADGNSPVVVDLFKFSTDPLKELALISDTFGEFVLEGALLYDGSRLTGSKFFSAKKLAEV